MKLNIKDVTTAKQLLALSENPNRVIAVAAANGFISGTLSEFNDVNGRTQYGTGSIPKIEITESVDTMFPTGDNTLNTDLAGILALADKTQN